MTDLRPETTPERARWPYLSLLPLGAGAWAPIYAGVRARMVSATVLGLLFTVITVAGWVKSSISDSGHDDIAGTLIVIGWIGAVATSFSLRSAYEQRVTSPLRAAELAGEQRLRERDAAIALARSNPALAAEIGVGRPDRPGAADAGIVDVNNASGAALARLPGVGATLAQSIVATRERTSGFSSLEDMAEWMDLDGGLVERLRGQGCLPAPAVKPGVRGRGTAHRSRPRTSPRSACA